MIVQVRIVVCTLHGAILVNNFFDSNILLESESESESETSSIGTNIRDMKVQILVNLVSCFVGISNDPNNLVSLNRTQEQQVQKANYNIPTEVQIDDVLVSIKDNNSNPVSTFRTLLIFSASTEEISKSLLSARAHCLVTKLSFAFDEYVSLAKNFEEMKNSMILGENFDVNQVASDAASGEDFDTLDEFVDFEEIVDAICMQDNVCV